MEPPHIILTVILCYLGLLLALGLFSGKLFRGTSKDYFVASHSIGPFLLLMSVFGTTMTAFALVGSTGKSFERGVGTYGLMASISCLIHAACFFLIGIRLWMHGKRLGFVTQIQFFRARFESNALGYLLFPVLVGLVIPYLLIGVVGVGKTLQPITAGAFPDAFPHPAALLNGGIPPWLSGLGICIVVVIYVFAGGSRGAAWANTFQTIVFMAMGVVAFMFIVKALGGLENAANVPAQFNDKGQLVQKYGFDKEAGKVVELPEPKVIGSVVHAEDAERVAGKQPHMIRDTVEIQYKAKNPITGEISDEKRELGVPFLMFLTYLFIPLSVGMFPHLFQHWLTARSAKSFRLTVIAHPLCIMIVWVPCVLIGIWASGILPPAMNPAAVLSNMLNTLIESPVLTGLLTAGVLAAIMSSLDSQFLCLGTIFTNDIVLHAAGENRYSEKTKVWIARIFIIAIVVTTYWLAMVALKNNVNVFDMAIWCFSGFASLTPIVFGALYWRGCTKLGVIASLFAVVATWCYFFFFETGGTGEEITYFGGIMPVAFMFAASLVALVVVSKITPKPSEKTINKFFPKSKKPIEA